MKQSPPPPHVCHPDPTLPSLASPPTPALQTFGVSHRELRAMTVAAADYTFLPDKEKRALRKRLQATLGAVVEVAEEGEEEDSFAEDALADTFAPLPSKSAKLIGSEGSEPPEPPPEPQACPQRRSWVGRRSWGSRRSNGGGGSSDGSGPQMVPAAASGRPRFSWRSFWVRSG